MELYLKLTTDEYFIKARLISLSYLLPDGANHEVIKNYFNKKPNIAEITEFLSKGTEEDKEARVYISALTNFFMSVERARRVGLIKKDEKIFSPIYAYYWVHVICPYADEHTHDEQHQKLSGLLDIDEHRKCNDEIYAKGLYASRYNTDVFKYRFEKPQQQRQLSEKTEEKDEKQ